MRFVSRPALWQPGCSSVLGIWNGGGREKGVSCNVWWPKQIFFLSSFSPFIFPSSLISTLSLSLSTPLKSQTSFFPLGKNSGSLRPCLVINFFLGMPSNFCPLFLSPFITEWRFHYELPFKILAEHLLNKSTECFMNLRNCSNFKV